MLKKLPPILGSSNVPCVNSRTLPKTKKWYVRTANFHQRILALSHLSQPSRDLLFVLQLLAPADVTDAHITAQKKRCTYFEKQIEDIEDRIKYMSEGGDALIPDDSSDEEIAVLGATAVSLNDEERKLLESSDTSDISDDSWDEDGDFLSFESTVVSKRFPLPAGKCKILDILLRTRFIVIYNHSSRNCILG